jgi:hypothetical protein
MSDSAEKTRPLALVQDDAKLFVESIEDDAGQAVGACRQRRGC